MEVAGSSGKEANVHRKSADYFRAGSALDDDSHDGFVPVRPAIRPESSISRKPVMKGRINILPEKSAKESQRVPKGKEVVIPHSDSHRVPKTIATVPGPHNDSVVDGMYKLLKKNSRVSTPAAVSALITFAHPLVFSVNSPVVIAEDPLLLSSGNMQFPNRS
jgi:hypothetical protein